MGVLGEFLHQHLHEKISAFLGAGVSLLAPGDILTKIVVGTVTGVLVWCITKAISWVVKRLSKRKCECDSCKE